MPGHLTLPESEAVSRSHLSYCFVVFRDMELIVKLNLMSLDSLKWKFLV